MRNCAILLLAIVTSQVSAGTAWRWVDASGTVHYSDRPVPGAEEVYLPDSHLGTPRTDAPPAPTTSQQPPSAAASAPAPEAAVRYVRLAISSPAQDETLWNIEGVLSVEVNIQPRLQDGHRVIFVLDGQRRNPIPGSGSSFTLDEVYRGLHTLQALVVDSSNTTVIESLPVQFMVQQPSLLNPNRG